MVIQRPGDMIGRYKLLEQIGEGGFGVVYMAEQVEPVRRKVALKIIKAGMDTREVIARFEAERQALAMMDHSNIAHVLDAGTTQAGRPYFVMELVQGIPITEFCDKRQLNTTQRLRLFIHVCKAVQHAHQKGIIHRDLKPSNILVTHQESEPQPKIIDFGVAKALGRKLTEKTLFTGFLKMVGTPAYMSPEQAEFTGMDIDTRSDVYSLGVLLYELLTGVTPFDSETIRKAAFDELRRLIRETEPPKPSTRLQTLGEKLTEVAKHRHTEPPRLVHSVRGDLDWIVMKCLEKDRRRRYETANGLAMDVQRHLDNEPVVARPPSRLYEFQKTVRRHKFGFATTAAIIVALTGAVVVSSWQAVRATRAEREQSRLRREAENEHRRAEANLLQAKEAVDTWLTKVAEDFQDVPQTTVIRRELLEAALKFYEGFLEQRSDDPGFILETSKAYLRISQLNFILKRHAESIVPGRQAIRITEDLVDRFPGRADYQFFLSEQYGILGVHMGRLRPGEASELMEKQIELLKELVSRFPADPNYRHRLADAHVDLANLLGASPGREAEAEELCREALRQWEQFDRDFSDPERQEFGESFARHWLASKLMHSGRYSEAETHLRKAVVLRSRLVDKMPGSAERRQLLGHAQIHLGDTLAHGGKPREAEASLQAAVEIYRGLVDDFPNVAMYREQLILAYRIQFRSLCVQEQFTEAEQIQHNILELWTVGPGDDPDAASDRGWAHYDLGLVIYQTGRIDEAAGQFRAALACFMQESDSELDRSRVDNALRWTWLTCPLAEFRDPERALQLCEEFVERDSTSADHWGCLGLAHYRLGHWEEATTALEKSLELKPEGNHEALYFLAMSRWQQGEKEEAGRLLQRANQRDYSYDKYRSLLDFRWFRQEAEDLMRVDE